MEKEKLFCKGGGCTAKLGAGILSRVLSKLPQGPEDENLLVGYDSKDDAAVYKISDDIAFVQTLDFFPPMVDDPYTFGKIAATNALSDIYAMGGEVKTALNIVCFPEKMDLNILGEIMRGGAEKVIEAGGTLAGGHSIADSDVKYGLIGYRLVNPNKIYTNNGAKAGRCTDSYEAAWCRHYLHSKSSRRSFCGSNESRNRLHDNLEQVRRRVLQEFRNPCLHRRYRI